MLTHSRLYIVVSEKKTKIPTGKIEQKVGVVLLKYATQNHYGPTSSIIYYHNY